MCEDGACHAKAFEFLDIGAFGAVAWCAAGVGVIVEALVSAEQFGSFSLVVIAERRKRLEYTVNTAAFAVEEFLGGVEAAVAEKRPHRRVVEMVFEEAASNGEEEAEPRVRSMEFLCEKKGLCKALDAVFWGFVKAVDVEAKLGSIFVLFALDVEVRIEEAAEVFEDLE